MQPIKEIFHVEVQSQIQVTTEHWCYCSNFAVVLCTHWVHR